MRSFYPSLPPTLPCSPPLPFSPSLPPILKTMAKSKLTYAKFTLLYFDLYGPNKHPVISLRKEINQSSVPH